MDTHKTELMYEFLGKMLRFHFQMTEWSNGLAARENLTATNWLIITCLWREGAQSVPQIAARVGMTRQGVQKQIDFLRGEGIVVVRENPAHKRSPLYALTEEGWAAGERMRDIVKAESALWAMEFSQEELENAHRVMNRLMDRLAEKKPPQACENISAKPFCA